MVPSKVLIIFEGCCAPPPPFFALLLVFLFLEFLKFSIPKIPFAGKKREFSQVHDGLLTISRRSWLASLEPGHRRVRL